MYVVTTNRARRPFVSVKTVYNELHQTLMSISDQEDAKWWKNNHGPGMPTDWPKIEVNTCIIQSTTSEKNNKLPFSPTIDLWYIELVPVQPCDAFVVAVLLIKVLISLKL